MDHGSVMPPLPEPIREAVQQGYWKDPGSRRLKQILSIESSDPLVLLSRDKIESATRQIATRGYVEDPQFCMVRSPAELHGPEDRRLAVSHLIFIVTSSRPGDDAFLQLTHRKNLCHFYGSIGTGRHLNDGGES
jgi:hypothetical protein